RSHYQGGRNRNHRYHCIGRRFRGALQHVEHLNFVNNGTKIEIRNLTMAYGDHVIMRDINARVKRGSVFVIMGNSGSGKSTLLRHMIGLQSPASGDVFYDGQSFGSMDDDERRAQLRKCGVLFQSGALWSSMTLAENVALPLQEYTNWSASDLHDIVRL